MKQNKLLDAIGMIDDNLIEKAEARRGVLKPIVRRSIISSAAAVLALVITLAVVFAPQKDTSTPLTSSSQTVSTTSSDLQETLPPSSQNTSQTVSISPVGTTIVQPAYPKQAAYPLGMTDSDPRYSAMYDAWEDACIARRKSYDSSININPFLQKSIPQILSEANGQNVVYSPINVYLALGMLIEVTDGASRQQILDLLGYKNVASLRKDANSIFNSHYSDDGVYTNVLANSVWLNKDITYKKQPLETIADNYYASSFSGDMGSPEYDKKLQDWLNSNTGGLLKDQINGVSFPKDSAIALASAIYYRSKWETMFSSEDTKNDIFHTKNGDITYPFMNQSTPDYVYYGKGFSAYRKYFQLGGSMYFILPDESVTPEELIKEKDVTDFYSWDEENKNTKFAMVNLSIPKFDVTSQITLTSSLKKLGVSDVFNSQKSNFSPLMQNYKGVCVSGATHDARVIIDEEGCEAAAYTLFLTTGGVMNPTETIDFKLDRPFIFVVTSEHNLPLFVGIVNQPN